MPYAIQSMDDFDKQLEEAGDKLVVVDFWADWCGPCKMMAPKFEELSKEYTDVKFLKVNTDDQGKISEDQNITALPTFRFFKNKTKLADDVVGANLTLLTERIKQYC
ncbi:thioredoxin domain-containing protein [Gigaspora margarita]|uniref:Thioredoxin n=1 Tax=Gigaspora margarita TaxID=4874 RepID=A0A8H4EG98_GIGMA|nr:thioredoxin domain-containing protein [Gigaspora margarita]